MEKKKNNKVGVQTFDGSFSEQDHLQWFLFSKKTLVDAERESERELVNRLVVCVFPLAGEYRLYPA